MLDEKFVLLAVVFNLIGGARYIDQLLKGRVKPNKVSWLLWGLAPMVAFAAQISKGVGWPSIMTFIFGFSPFIIFSLSFFVKNAYWKITKFDIFCGLISIAGIILWFITKEGDSAIFFSIMADFFAGVPTLIKAFNKPETEDALAFGMPILGAGVTLLTLDNWSFAYSSFPLYVFIFCTFTTLLIQFKLGKIISRSFR